MGNSDSSPSKERTQSAQEEWKNLAEQDYEQLLADCQRTQSLFCDPEFPAEDSSINFSDTLDISVDWRRPHEICQSLGKEPEFCIDGGTRFDLIQGNLGDCWVIAAAGSLAGTPLLNRVVPPDQTFKQPKYAGIFRFNFYRFGNWVQVVVDDRLPVNSEGKLVMVQSASPNEFWSSLLEKAYAKLHGSYEALKAGLCPDALTDFTAGVVETYILRERATSGNVRVTAPTNLAQYLFRAVKRGALLTAGINGDWRQEQVLPNGLVTGHAYTVSDVQLVKYNESVVPLIRVRNPWGNKYEWTGAWSDGSREWLSLTEQQKTELSEKLANDGDFWMELRDFIENFDEVDICNLTPDSVTTDTLRAWQTMVIHSAWVNGSTAGGRLKSRSYELNPQFEITVTDAEDEDSCASVLIELTQKDRRTSRNNGYDFLSIGYALYALTEDDHLPVSYQFLSSNERVGVSYYMNIRAIVKRFDLKPGRYLLVPSAWDMGEEAEFMVRVWSEKPTDSNTVDVRLPEPSLPNGHTGDDAEELENDETDKTENGIEVEEDGKPDFPQRNDDYVDALERETIMRLFRNVSGEDVHVTAFELQAGLNSLYAASNIFEFSLECCQVMIAFMERNGSGLLRAEQFVVLYKFLKLWTVFRAFDWHVHGYLSKQELCDGLSRLGHGYMTSEIYRKLGTRFADLKHDALESLNSAQHTTIDKQEWFERIIAMW